jgi:hypothetical protein
LRATKNPLARGRESFSSVVAVPPLLILPGKDNSAGTPLVIHTAGLFTVAAPTHLLSVTGVRFVTLGSIRGSGRSGFSASPGSLHRTARATTPDRSRIRL